VIELNPELVERKMGFEIPASEQLEIFDRLGFAVDASVQPWKVTVPTYRNTKDIEEPIDLVEELGRVAGYDRIVPSSPQLSLDAKPPREAHTKNRVLQDGLVSMGYSEVKSYSFASEQELMDLDWLPRAMKLANPMSKDQAYMRPGLLVRQMEIWALNAKNLEAFAMFEMGVVFERRSDRQLPDERLELCASRYGESDQGEDLYQLKADVTCALEAMGVDGLTWSKAEDVHVCAHPARVGVLRMNGEVCGTIAELHPARAKKLGLKKRITFAVIDAPMALPARENIKYQGLDRFPAVPFSCSFIVDARTTAGEVMACIQSADAALIQDLKWMGNYSGASTPEGKISMTFAMNFRRSDRTMNADEIQSLQSTIIEKAKAQNFNLRES
jgi:phenylalanyl-tRNA synthetase beta chain